MKVDVWIYYQYERQANVNDREAYTWKCCAQCRALCDRIFATDHDSYDSDFGLNIGEWLDESQSSLASLYFARWRDDAGVLTPVEIVVSMFNADAGVSG